MAKNRKRNNTDGYERAISIRDAEQITAEMCEMFGISLDDEEEEQSEQKQAEGERKVA